MTDRFRIELIVPKRLVGPLIELTDPECIVVTVESADTPPLSKQRRRHISTHRRMSPKRDGKSARGLYLDAVSRNTSGLTNAQLESIFKANNRAPTSVSSTKSILLRSGLITVDAAGISRIVEGVK